MKPGLRLALDTAREIGAEEGSVDAAARARRPAVLRNSFAARPADDRAVRFAVTVGDLFAFTQMHSDRDLTPEAGPIPHDLTDED